MQKIKIAVLIAAALIFAFNFFAGDRISSAQTRSTPVAEIAGYKNWTKVNSTPTLMPERVAVSCALWLSPNNVVVDGDKSPHRDKFFTVYVNDIGRKAMLEELHPQFPEGSVIVKEKLPDEKSLTPELLTVMIKQKAGSNPENGDWEYMVVDGTGTKVEGRGALQNCQECHIANRDSDYIFRTYLTKKIQADLR